MRSSGRPGATFPSRPTTVSATNSALQTASSVASTVAWKTEPIESSPEQVDGHDALSDTIASVRRREGAEDLAGVVTRDAAHPGQTEPDAAGDAHELAGIERDVRGDDADAAAGIAPSTRRGVGTAREAVADRRAGNAQLLSSAEVGEHEHPDDAHSLEDS